MTATPSLTFKKNGNWYLHGVGGTKALSGGKD